AESSITPAGKTLLRARRASECIPAGTLPSLAGASGWSDSLPDRGNIEDLDRDIPEAVNARTPVILQSDVSVAGDVVASVDGDLAVDDDPDVVADRLDDVMIPLSRFHGRPGLGPNQPVPALEPQAARPVSARGGIHVRLVALHEIVAVL